MLAAVAWQVFDTAREIRRGVATFKTRSGYVICEFQRTDEPLQFWMLLIAKFVLLAVIAFIAIEFMGYIN